MGQQQLLRQRLRQKFSTASEFSSVYFSFLQQSAQTMEEKGKRKMERWCVEG